MYTYVPIYLSLSLSIYIYIYTHKQTIGAQAGGRRTPEGGPDRPDVSPSLRSARARADLGIHQRGVQSEGGAVDGGSIISLNNL